MKTDVEALRKKYMDNPPEGLTSTDIRHMSEEDLLDMDYFLNDDDLDEENITLANDDFTAMAAVILEGLGGSANVKSIDNCITRLRLEINDDNKIDEAKIKSSGAAGIIRPGKGNIQVIIGPKVQFVADEFSKLCE